MLRNRRILILLSLTMIQHLLSAQSTMHLVEKSGTKSTLSLNSIKKLTFSAMNVQIYKVDFTAETYALNDIGEISFTEVITGIVHSESNGNTGFKLYPNPAGEELEISYDSENTDISAFRIIDLQGKILINQVINTRQGSNQLAINVSNLRKGIYLALLQNGNKLRSLKFIKN